MRVTTTHTGQDGRRYRAEGCMALGSECRVTNDPLGEPGRNPLYVDLSTWGSVVGDHMFSSCFRRYIN